MRVMIAPDRATAVQSHRRDHTQLRQLTKPAITRASEPPLIGPEPASLYQVWIVPEPKRPNHSSSKLEIMAVGRLADQLAQIALNRPMIVAGRRHQRGQALLQQYAGLMTVEFGYDDAFNQFAHVGRLAIGRIKLGSGILKPIR